MRENRFVLLRDTGKSLLVYDRFDKSMEYMHYDDVMGAVMSGIGVDEVSNKGYNPLIYCKDDTALSNMIISAIDNRLFDGFNVNTNFVDDMVIVRLYYNLDLNIQGDNKSYVYREYDGTQMMLPEYDWDDSGMIESVYKSDMQKGWDKLPFNIQQVSSYDNGGLQLNDGYISYYNFIEWRYNRFDEEEVKRWLEVVKNIFN